MLKVLAIVADGFEEIETVAPIDILRRAGIDVTLVSLGEDLLVKGRTGVVLQADRALASLSTQTPFDCLFLPGGPHVKSLRQDVRIKALVNQHAAAGKWIAAICAAPLLLSDAGLLTPGKRYTAHSSVANELPDILAGLRVVTDGKIITSRGAGTSIDFGLAIVEHLLSPAKAREVSAAICA